MRCSNIGCQSITRGSSSLTLNGYCASIPSWMANSSSIAACPSKLIRCRRSSSEATASNNRPALDVSGACRCFASSCAKQPAITSVEALHRREVRALKPLGAPHFIQQTERGATRLADRTFPSRQSKGAKMRGALEGRGIVAGDEKFPAPHRAVEPETRTVRRPHRQNAGHTDRRRR